MSPMGDSTGGIPVEGLRGQRRRTLLFVGFWAVVWLLTTFPLGWLLVGLAGRGALRFGGWALEMNGLLLAAYGIANTRRDYELPPLALVFARRVGAAASAAWAWTVAALAAVRTAASSVLNRIRGRGPKGVPIGQATEYSSTHPVGSSMTAKWDVAPTVERRLSMLEERTRALEQGVSEQEQRVRLLRDDLEREVELRRVTEERLAAGSHSLEAAGAVLFAAGATWSNVPELLTWILR